MSITARAPATIPATLFSPACNSASSDSPLGGDHRVCWRATTSLGVKVGQQLLTCTLELQIDSELLGEESKRRARKYAHAGACRREFSGSSPGSSTTTLRGRTSTSATTSWATCCSIRRTSVGSCHRLDSTATAKVSRECPASRRTATAHPGRTPETRRGGAFDVGRVDVAPSHDDHVLDPAAHYETVVLGEVAQIAGVIPALGVLGGDEAAHRFVTQRHGLPAHLENADAAGGQDGPPSSTTRASSPFNSRPSVASHRVCRCSPVRLGAEGQQVGVDLVDHQPTAALGERHRDGGLRHAVCRQDGVGAQPKRPAGLAEVFDIGGFDLFAARQRPSQAGKIELGRVWPACEGAWRTVCRRSSAPRSSCLCTCRSVWPTARRRAGNPSA